MRGDGESNLIGASDVLEKIFLIIYGPTVLTFLHHISTPVTNEDTSQVNEFLDLDSKFYLCFMFSTLKKNVDLKFVTLVVTPKLYKLKPLHLC